MSWLFPMTLAAQDIPSLLLDGANLEKSFHDQEALQKYIEVLKREPNHLQALCKSSELYNVLGKRQASKEKQKEYYNAGREYAVRAIKVNPNYADANFVMAISLGRIALVSSGEDKIKAVKEIKNYADNCIRLDPSSYKGYHVLGKWHYEVSDLSSMERWLVKLTYGALPKSSLEESILNYEKSMRLNPRFLLNYLELAKACIRKEDKNKAASLLETMMKLPPISSDDIKIKAMGKKMLEELKN
ncbi:MAG: hypothetical protein ABI687_09140 [Flavitalea sp.]